MIVFENGRPLKSDYKRFAIKDVAGQDDYASMQEVLRRRFTRYLENDPAFSRLPDLILLDGGKGHVAAVEPLLKELGIDVPLFGMVKDMDERGKIVNIAFAVPAAFVFGDHLGFTAGYDAAMLGPVIAAKLTGGVLAVLAALLFTRKKPAQNM